MPIPVAPHEIQKRIVAKVDELMALCDALETQQKERETKLAQLAKASLAAFADAPSSTSLELLFHPSFSIDPADLRKSILTLAVQGKLVERLHAEGDSKEILDASNVSELETEVLPTLPIHWAWARLGDLATRMDSGWSPACIPERAEANQWGVLKTTAVQSLQYLEEQNKQLPSHLKPRPENEVAEGDILFTRAGPMNRVGIVCVARPTRSCLMISDKIIRIHCIDGFYPDFVALALNAGFSAELIEELKSGMAASQVNISQPKLKTVAVPVPPLAEQKRIVAKVDELMALVDRLEAKIVASREAGSRLLEAMVAELSGKAA